ALDRLGVEVRRVEKTGHGAGRVRGGLGALLDGLRRRSGGVLGGLLGRGGGVLGRLRSRFLGSLGLFRGLGGGFLFGLLGGSGCLLGGLLGHRRFLGRALRGRVVPVSAADEYEDQDGDKGVPVQRVLLPKSEKERMALLSQNTPAQERHFALRRAETGLNQPCGTTS